MTLAGTMELVELEQMFDHGIPCETPKCGAESEWLLVCRACRADNHYCTPCHDSGVLEMADEDVLGIGHTCGERYVYVDWLACWRPI